MKQIIYLAHVSALCMLACAASADTVTVDTSDAGLEEVVVVANRTPEPLSKVGSSVTVLTEEQIGQSQALPVADLLVRTPGLTLARNGGLGSPTSVFIRGAESAQTLVLIDGVQLNDPSSPGGGFDFGNLLTSGMSRIEILRGAQSTLYGSQAIGGVINITTADPAKAFGGGVTAEGGHARHGLRRRRHRWQGGWPDVARHRKLSRHERHLDLR